MMNHHACCCIFVGCTKQLPVPPFKGRTVGWWTDGGIRGQFRSGNKSARADWNQLV